MIVVTFMLCQAFQISRIGLKRFVFAYLRVVFVVYLFTSKHRSIKVFIYHDSRKRIAIEENAAKKERLSIRVRDKKLSKRCMQHDGHKERII